MSGVAVIVNILLRLLCSTLIVTSCVSIAAAQDVAKEPPAVGKAAEVESKPISEDEANQFVDKFSGLILRGDREGANKLIDWDGVLALATQTPESPKLASVRKAFSTASVQQLRSAAGITAKIYDELKRGGSYKCVRIEINGPEPFAMYRFNLAQQRGVNYHRIYLKRNADGSIVASDVFVLLTAERLSETLRRSWVPFAQSELRSGLERLLLPRDPYVDSLVMLGKFAQLAASQKSVEALELYRKLPPAAQRDKSALVLRVVAASTVSEEEFLEAVKDLRKYLPDDVAADFILVGSYRIRRKFAEALECLDRTSKRMGGDSMLLVSRAQILLEMKRVPEAREAIEDAILGEPDLSDAYSIGIDVSLADQNFDETVKYLTILESQFGQKWKDLREVPGFAEFVKTPQYEKWAETQKK
jgi:tetratricopeptide (TPR) repeat protein